MKKNKFRKLSLFSGAILLVTTISALVYMAVGIINILNDISTSFPWYYACYMTLIYFGGPLLLEILLFLYFYLRYISLSNKNITYK